MLNSITFLGETDFRGKNTLFGIRQHDRLHHCYIAGKTGTGKTTLLDLQLRQDILAGRGCAFIDPHGDLAERLVSWIPEAERERLIYLNLPDANQPWGYNPLRRVSPERRPLVASGVLEVFQKLWTGKAWGVRMEHILRNTLLTLLEQPEATFADIPRLLNERTYRKEAVARVTNPSVREFWSKEYEAYTKASRIDATAPILNKTGAFLANPILRRVLVAPKRELRFRKVIDEGSILIVNLAKGKIGDDAAHLAGALLLTSLGLAAFSRADIPEEHRTPYLIYTDEFQNFTTLSVASMLSELRKYGVGMVVASQYFSHIEPEIREALFGNVGTLVSFRLGAHDAHYMAREFAPVFSEEDIIGLPRYHFLLRLMIDGSPSKPFSAVSVQYEDTDAA